MHWLLILTSHISYFVSCQFQTCHFKMSQFPLQIRVSAVLTNGVYLLNVDCDHYINNSKALKEAMCFMMDPEYGRKTCYVQFPQRFDGIDFHDRYANRNIVFFDVSHEGYHDHFLFFFFLH